MILGMDLMCRIVAGAVAGALIALLTKDRRENSATRA
jgi:hypothetical protein